MGRTTLYWDNTRAKANTKNPGLTQGVTIGWQRGRGGRWNRIRLLSIAVARGGAAVIASRSATSCRVGLTDRVVQIGDRDARRIGLIRLLDHLGESSEIEVRGTLSANVERQLANRNE